MQDECSHCHGERAEPGTGMKTCEMCKGSGQISKVMNTMFGQIQQSVVCQTCEGRGRIPEQICTVCKGRGTERRTQDIKLKIPAGIDDGATVRLRGVVRLLRAVPVGTCMYIFASKLTRSLLVRVI